MESEQHFLRYCGTVLSNQDIQSAIRSGDLQIRSPMELSIQPASIEIHLAQTVAFLMRERFEDGVIDFKKPTDNFLDYREIDPQHGLTIPEGTFFLGVSREWFSLPDQLRGKLDSNSSFDSLGLTVYTTAGLIDPGFQGHITLELKNNSGQPLIIYPDIKIGQISFSVLTSPATPYSGRYRNEYSENPKPIPSQYWRNFLQK